MKSILNKTYKGFTIIEVMIVLAIAGLIMVIVFFAIPQLQRNQRDNARQSALTRMKAEMETYASNNQGLYPFQTTACATGSNAGRWCDFYNRYINGQVNIDDPSTGSPMIGASPSGTACNGSTGCVRGYASGISLPDNAGETAVIYGAKCSGEDIQASGAASTTAKAYAMLVGLDRAGTRYCVDNG
jgi:prepilin-type N-terminal cleavage/methylation domain-containing protein